MKIFSFIIFVGLSLSCHAGDWSMSTKKSDTSNWTTPLYSTYGNYIDEVNVECHANIIYRPKLIKIIFEDGREEIINCDEHNKTHPKR
ncbi:hypothetical protein ACU6U9_02855 [Pseudomonas sp. HK3]